MESVNQARASTVTRCDPKLTQPRMPLHITCLRMINENFRGRQNIPAVIYFEKGFADEDENKENKPVSSGRVTKHEAKELNLMLKLV